MHRFWLRVWRLLAYTPPRRCDNLAIRRRVHGARTGDFGHVAEQSDRAIRVEVAALAAGVGRSADATHHAAVAALAATAAARLLFPAVGRGRQRTARLCASAADAPGSRASGAVSPAAIQPVSAAG